jgi:hypothetical protein
LVQAAVGQPEFPDEVSTFDVSSFSQTLLKRLEWGLEWLPLAQESDPVDLSRKLLLRLCIADGPGDEPGGSRQDRQKDERANANRPRWVAEAKPVIEGTHRHNSPWCDERDLS